MFTGGSIKPFDIGTVIRWIDGERAKTDWGTIVSVSSGHYVVKNFRQEQRLVAIHDPYIRVVRHALGKTTPPEDIFLCDLNEHVNKVWTAWKANK